MWILDLIFSSTSSSSSSSQEDLDSFSVYNFDGSSMLLVRPR